MPQISLSSLELSLQEQRRAIDRYCSEHPEFREFIEGYVAQLRRGYEESKSDLIR